MAHADRLMRETAGWGRACAQGGEMVVHVHCGPRLSRPVIVSAPRWRNLHPHIASVRTPSKSILTIFMPRMSRRKEREGGDDFSHRSCYYLPSFLSILYFPQAECKLLITFGSSEGPERNPLASRATIRAFANSAAVECRLL